MWAGTWHSACFHEACLPCIRQWVERSLPACRATRTLRVTCYAPGCKKSLPQKLVLAASFGARLLAEGIDKHEDSTLERTPCPTCGLQCESLTNKNCGHTACENCWENWAQVQAPTCAVDGQLRVQCLVKGCRAPVHTDLWKALLAYTTAVQHCIDAANKADAEMVRLEKFAKADRCGASPAEAGPVCPVCQQHCIALLRSNEASDDCQKHMACEGCWAKWFEEQLDHCRSHRTASVRCIGCPMTTDTALWKHACTQSPAVNEMDQQLARRLRLQQNQNFPASLQINCPEPRCVGLGYLGYDTVMCFICEHQWSPEDHFGEPPPDPDVEVVMGVRVKRCPKCFQYIEKNGGCDHMTCQHRGCGHEFWWSTLKPYKV